MIRLRVVLLAIATATIAGDGIALAAELRLSLPLGREHYQTNELIDLTAIRRGEQALSKGVLKLALSSEDGSRLEFSFPADEAPLVANEAKAVEHVRLNGWLLRPGHYMVDAVCDGASAQISFKVHSHIRQSSYRLIHWGGSRNEMMTIEGRDGLGFNLAMGDTGELSIASGQDIMGTCLMGGGHQHDLKVTNDWSDPNVYIGAIQRGLDRALGFRTQPNAIGAHLHDEPGLTWLPHPRVKDNEGKPVVGPHDISFQRAAYQRAYGDEPIWLDEADTTDPQKLEAWTRMNDFKLGFMDAYWKASRHALEKMKPGYLAVTQTQYGWNAIYDGYYFNVARSLPVISGHGGYSHYWLYNLNPSFYLEASLPRQLDKPTWYLPEWGTTDLDGLRQVQHLSFITGIQGIAQWPGINVDSPHAGAIVETNKLYARLGTVFAKPQFTRHPLALLYSKSNAYYNKGHTQLQDLASLYVATRLTQHPVSFVLDEDIVDGTLAASHKAIIIAGATYLDHAVITALEAFAAEGGVVFTTADSKVSIAGATKLDVTPDALVVQAEEGLSKIADPTERTSAEGKVRSFRAWLEYAEPTAKVLRQALQSKGIEPVFECDVATIAPGRQVRGEIEYLFGVNVTPREGYGGFGKPVSATVKLSLEDDGRPIYNAITGGLAQFTQHDQRLTAELAVGPGQLLAFARPARQIGGVQVGTPAVTRDFTREDDSPICVEFDVAIMDAQHRVIAGAAPLQITLTDPLGEVRYDLYRATDAGTLTLKLPLAANDPAGSWTVTVKELLANSSDSSSFTYQPAQQCGALAGLSHGALFFPADKPNFYDFFRSHREVSLVAGESEHSKKCAERLATILKPYNVTATIVSLAEANRARPLTDEEAKTWCGASIAGDLDPNARNNPQLVGYNLPRPTVLLGNAEDNPLIKRLQDAKVLPYPPGVDLPGRGRGMLAWNVMTLGHDVEAIALIADDADGLNEAVGTLFTLAAGIDAVTPLELPASSRIALASKRTEETPLPKQLWQIYLSDRVENLAATNGQILATTANDRQVMLDLNGIVMKSTAVADSPAPETLSADASRLPQEKLRPELRMKQVVLGPGTTAVAYWGGRLQVFDDRGAVKAGQQFSQDITAMTYSDDLLLIGTADGAVVALQP